MLGEQLLMEERQLDGIGDRLDLDAETTDVVVTDVGDLLQQQLVHLGTGQDLEHDRRPGVDAHAVAETQSGAAQRAGELADPLLVATAGDHDADAVLEQVLEGGHLADGIRSTVPDDR